MPNYCWIGCINLSEFEEYTAVIANILIGHATVEKMVGHNIYKTRINRSDRLFWITHVRQGQAYIEILEIILNHDYQKSRWLRPGVLQHYLEKRTLATANAATNIDEVPCVPAEFSPAVRYYDQRFIEYTPEQNQVFSAQTPVIITGAAGSGKSCVLFEALQKMCAQMDREGATGQILYVAQSTLLVSNIRSMWGESDQRVLFLSYNELVQHLDPSCTLENKMGSEYFFSWFTSYIEQKERACRTGHFSAENLVRYSATTCLDS